MRVNVRPSIILIGVAVARIGWILSAVLITALVALAFWSTATIADLSRQSEDTSREFERYREVVETHVDDSGHFRLAQRWADEPHATAVKSGGEGADPCFECHRPTYCAECHTK